jgi:Cytochrome P460
MIVGAAGISAMVAAVARGQQIDTTASSNGRKLEAVVDAAGNLHVPDAYRTTYQFLGSWAVAADQGKGSKELHVVYASPETITAYRKDRRFPDGAVALIRLASTENASPPTSPAAMHIATTPSNTRRRTSLSRKRSRRARLNTE